MSASSVSRRERILTAAASEFARVGFAGARIDRIAATAGVNKQLLFHYFGSKDGLHKAALGSVLERFDVSAQPSKTPAEGLRAVVTQLLAAIAAHPALLSMLAGAEEQAEGSEGVQSPAQDWRTRASQAITQTLRNAQHSGYIRDDVDPALVSEVIVAASLGWLAASGVEGGSQAADHMQQFGEGLVKLILDFCAWR
jgi:TetR/AcrR family transcriptional regulator